MIPISPILILELAAFGVERINPGTVESWMMPKQRENPRDLGLITFGVVSEVNSFGLLEGRRRKEF